jgi:hypothetical protein
MEVKEDSKAVATDEGGSCDVSPICEGGLLKSNAHIQYLPTNIIISEKMKESSRILVVCNSLSPEEARVSVAV